MRVLIILSCCLYTVLAADTCEMDIQPGVFGSVVDGTYITQNVQFLDYESCMQGCCDQANDPNRQTVACNMAYFYQKPDPSNPVALTSYCVYWNCEEGHCKPSRDIDPQSTSPVPMVGFLLPETDSTKQQPPSSDTQGQMQGQTADQQGQYTNQQGQYPDQQGQYTDQQGKYTDQQVQSQYSGTKGQYTGSQSQYTGSQDSNIQNSQQYTGQSDSSAQQPGYVDSQQKPGYVQNSYQPEAVGQDIPAQQSSQYGTQDNGMAQGQTNQYNDQGQLPTQGQQLPGQSQYINQAVASNDQPPQQSGTLPAQPAGTPGQWVYNPSTGQYVLVAADNQASSQESSNQVNQVANTSVTNSTSTQNSTSSNSTKDDEEDSQSAWSWLGNWWNGDDDDDDYDDLSEEEEKEWEAEEEEEEKEWEEELEEWEAEMENMTTTQYTTGRPTTMSPEEQKELEEEEADWEAEEAEEEQEMDAWLNGEPSDIDAQGDTGIQVDTGAQAETAAQANTGDSQYYKPETFPVSQQSSWVVNAPVIAVAACAGVVLVLLLLILLGKKLTGTNDRAQYKPLRESFSGSSTYHEDI